MSLVRPLHIGPLSTRTNLVLSPMSGVTDCAFRRLVRTCSGDSVGLLVSEFVAAEGLTRDNERTLSMLRYHESERPISIQIFGADVDRMVRAAEIVEAVGADVVDVNCGCPAPKVVKRGGGAELMRQPDRLRAILRGIRRRVSIPMTVKIRSGWDDDTLNAVTVARMVADEGAAMLAVHGRTRVQLYSGAADWDLVAQVRSQLAIPVLGSGDVVGPEDGVRRLSSGACDGVMIGRGAIQNPWIFAQVAAAAQARAVPVPSADDRVAALDLFKRLLRETLADRSFIGRFRGLACHFVKGMPGSAAVRRAIGESKTVENVEVVFADFVLGRRAGIDLEADVARECAAGSALGRTFARVGEVSRALPLDSVRGEVS